MTISLQKIHNRIRELEEEHDYDEEVSITIDLFKKELADNKSNGTLTLDVKFAPSFRGQNEEKIAEKVAKQLIQYRIREKAIQKLLEERLIKPKENTTVPIGENKVKFYLGDSIFDTTITFKRMPYRSFQRVK